MGVGRRLWTVVFQAGPAAACFLADQGHHVTIFDRVEDLAPVGAGIGVGGGERPWLAHHGP